MSKKYELTDETIVYDNKTLYRIVALKDFSFIKKGDLGGFVESEKNLSQEGDCWIFKNGKVLDNALVKYNASVCDEAVVKGNAVVGDHSRIFQNALIKDFAIIKDFANVFGNATIQDNAIIMDEVLVACDAIVENDVKIIGEAIITGNAKISKKDDYKMFRNPFTGKWVTWTRSNDMWAEFIYYGTKEEMVEKAYKHNEIYGRSYNSFIDCVEEQFIKKS